MKTMEKAPRGPSGTTPLLGSATKTSTAKATATPEFEPPVSGALIDENFSKVPEGQLPAGWTAPRSNAAVKAANSGRRPAKISGFRNTAVSNRPALELNDPAHSEEVDLPPIELAEDFVVETNFLLRTVGTCVRVQLQGKSTEILNLDVYGDGYVQAQDKYLVKSGSFALNASTRSPPGAPGAGLPRPDQRDVDRRAPDQHRQGQIQSDAPLLRTEGPQATVDRGSGRFRGNRHAADAVGKRGRSPQIFLVRVVPSAP